MKPNYYETNFEVKILREYLRIPSVHPNVDYEPCVEFLRQQAVILDLPVTIYYPRKRTKPVVVLTWAGLNPKLPAIMFNSHMDVAPVFSQDWNFSPFGADIDDDGRIYACGIQDSKSVGMQYLAAIRSLKKLGYHGQRTAHITFMPEEEVGGIDGMKNFVNMNAFKNLKIAFALDKGSPSHNEVVPIFNTERIFYEVTFKIRGTTGFASLMPRNTAGEKFQLLLHKLMSLRKENIEKLKSERKRLGDVCSVNLTKTSTLASTNNLPQLIEATFDIRLAHNSNTERFTMQLKQFIEEIGGGIEMVLTDAELKRGVTALDDSNVYWVALKEALNEAEVPYEIQVFPGTTDMRFLRDSNVKIPAINFAPMPETPKLAHNNNEYLHAETYLRGIEIYAVVMRALLNAGVPPEEQQEPDENV